MSMVLVHGRRSKGVGGHVRENRFLVNKWGTRTNGNALGTSKDSLG